jgi:hypothetical protein
MENIPEDFSIRLSRGIEKLSEFRTYGVHDHEIFFAVPIVFVARRKRMTVWSIDAVKVIWVEKTKMFATESATEGSCKGSNIPLFPSVTYEWGVQVDRSCEKDERRCLR